jgi:hypothetical protein
MPTLPLPFTSKPWWTADPIANANAATALFDGVLEPTPDGAFHLRRRPGLSLFADSGATTGGQGMHYSERLGAVFFVSGGKLYKIAMNSGTTVYEIGSGFGTGRVVFAEGQDLDSSPVIYMAYGSGLKYTKGTVVSTPSDPSTPSKATHVVWFSNRFIANEADTGQFWATGVDPGTGLMNNYYWSSTFNPFVAEAKGDNITALQTGNQELFVWGPEGLEVWQDDGVTPLLPIPSAFIETGILAPYSAIRANTLMFALCQMYGERCVVQFNGRNPTNASNSIARQLNEMTTVSDAVGTYLPCEGFAFYVLSFPTEKQTWAYDIKSDYWARWSYWNPDEFSAAPFLGTSAVYAKAWGKTLVQSRIDGKVYEVSRKTFADAGTSIRTVMQTGWVDHASMRRKRADGMYVRMKTQQMNGTPSVQMRWRDNGAPEWSSYMTLPVYPAGQYDSIAKMNRFGIFRSRQYELVMTDDADMAICGATLDLTELRN